MVPHRRDAWTTRRAVTARATSTLRGDAQPQYTTKIDALSLLANFYIDLGTWVGFTPYVGAGAGVTYLRSRDYDDTALAPIDCAWPTAGREFFLGRDGRRRLSGRCRAG